MSNLLLSSGVMSNVLNFKTTRTNNETSISKLLQLILSAEWFSIQCFSFFNMDDLAALDSAFTIHSWRNIWLKAPKLLNSIEVLIDKKEHIIWCKSRNLSIIHLSIYDKSSTITDESLLMLSEQCKSLTKLSCKYLWSVTPSGFASLMKMCPSLQELDFQLCSKTFITDKLLHNIGLYCNDLIRFKAMSSNCITGKGFESLFNGCQKLKHFEFINDDRYDPKSNHGDIDNGIKYNNFDLNTLLNIVASSQLESLSLKQVHLSSSSSLSPSLLSTTSSLLSMINNKHHHHPSSNFLIKEETNTAVSCLKSIDFSFVTGLTDTLLASIGSTFHFLESFKLELPPVDIFSSSSSSSYSYSSVILHNNNNSRHHHHRQHDEVSDKGIQAILMVCPHLTTLSVIDSDQKHTQITDEAFHRIADNCPYLNHITINHTNITNITLKEIGKLGAGSASTVISSLIKNKDDHNSNGIIAAAVAAKGLESVDLYKNSRITNEGIMQLVTSDCHSYTRNPSSSSSSWLEHIVLEIDGVGVTHQALYHIADHCPLLQSISLIYDDDNEEQNYHHHYHTDEQRTGKSLEYLLAHCPRLHTIDGNIPSMMMMSDEFKKELLHRQHQHQQVVGGEGRGGGVVRSIDDHDEYEINSSGSSSTYENNSGYNTSDYSNSSFDYDDGWR